jgi:proteasome lid subunit RPN8/RPN11
LPARRLKSLHNEETVSSATSVDATPRYWRWDSPGRAVSVNVAYPAIDAIHQALRELIHNAPIRGAELGGLLLGSSQSEAEALAVRIEAFEPFPSSYPRGASWLLDREGLDPFKVSLAAPRDLTVVGFFRSHTRKGLFLSDEDLAFLEEFFPAPGNVILLVKPFTTRPSQAGVFFRENGALPRETFAVELPFESPHLAEPAPRPALLPPLALPDLPEAVELPPARTLSVMGKIWIGLGTLGIAAAGLLGYVQYSSTHASKPALKPVAGTLHLAATEGDHSVAVTWDRQSPIIEAATHGSLLIQEASFRKTVEIDFVQLRNGRLVYSRPDAIADTIAFRLQVETSQGEPFTETLQFVVRRR